ncbi:hypothetical protein BVY01_03195 [bacterium I07]|nr:hypothetical protein BVY01_03195 [bacterium I07]
MSLRIFRADLHVHTCLSPCGELEMTPKQIVETSLRQNLDIIAICDHNSAENVQGVYDAAKTFSLTVLPGMEITTSEEVHLLGIFDNISQVRTLQEEVYANLLPGKNDEDLFGLQVVANKENEVESVSDRLLIGSTLLSLDEWIQIIHGLNGMAIPSHIDRDMFGLIGQLGFVPPDLAADALEISRQARVSGSDTGSLPEAFTEITCSDAHRLKDIGASVTQFHMSAPVISEMIRCFKARDGRWVRMEEPRS